MKGYCIIYFEHEGDFTSFVQRIQGKGTFNGWKNHLVRLKLF